MSRVPKYEVEGPVEANWAVTTGEAMMWSAVEVGVVKEPWQHFKPSIGLLHLSRQSPSDDWFVGGVAVGEKYRRQGIASALYRAAGRWGKSHGGFLSGWFVGKGPKALWEKAVEKGEAVLMPNGKFRRIHAAAPGNYRVALRYLDKMAGW